jgi:short-subunit dehydrogenase
MNYALVTGASKGIGKAIALELASYGYSILLVSRNMEGLRLVADEITSRYHVKADVMALDLSGVNAAKKVFDWCQEKGYPVQILVNNAGYGASGKYMDYSLELYTDMILLNVVTMNSLCHLFIPQMTAMDKAYILNISSIAAYQAVPGLIIYAATKAFILSFSRGLRVELKGSSISVTCVCPGPTDTDFVQRANVKPKALKVAARLKLRPEEVARIAVRGAFSGRAEIVAGFMNKLSVLIVWILPKQWVEKLGYKLYR